MLQQDERQRWSAQRRARVIVIHPLVTGSVAPLPVCPKTVLHPSRSQDPAGPPADDVTMHPCGLVVAVLTGKTKNSVRNAKIGCLEDREICPVCAYRERLVAEHGKTAAIKAMRYAHAGARLPGGRSTDRPGR
jgi:hypothetical protein